MTPEEKLIHLNDYLKHRIDIIMSDVNRWFIHSVDMDRAAAYYQLPTFDYYIENCVNDKGGKYDFTRIFTTTPTRHYNYSVWMGTEFNHEEVITL